MKKVTVIWSSPNEDGLTASAKNKFIKGLAGAGAEIQEIHLNGKKRSVLSGSIRMTESVMRLRRRQKLRS